MAGARKLGWRSLGVELTPLGCLISDVRLNPPHSVDTGLRLVEQWTTDEDGRDIEVPEELVG